MFGGKVYMSTLVLVTVGMFDLLTTIYLMGMGVREGNPLFAALADQGMLAFALGKLLFLGGPILLLEFARKTHPKSAEQGTWIAAAFYLLLYVSHLLQLRG